MQPESAPASDAWPDEWFEMTTPPDDERERAERGKPTDEDKKLGAESAAWTTERFAENEPASDFEHNLRITVRLGIVVERTANIAAAVHTLFLKAQRAKVEEKWAGVVSEFVGQEGERLDLTLTCVGVFRHSSTYGITNITRFRDPRGNVLVWFQSGSQSYRGWGKSPEKHSKEALEVGREYRIRATVKRHEERAFNGGPAEKQTILARASALPEGAPEMKPRKPRKKKAEEAEAETAAFALQAAEAAVAPPEVRLCLRCEEAPHPIEGFCPFGCACHVGEEEE